MERDRTTQIEEYRARFRTAPLGTWRTAQGTFDAVSSDSVTFRPDHTGTIEYRSSFSGEAAVGFEWREKAERVIEVRYAEDGTGAEESWDEISYDFRALDTDTGGEVALHEVGQDGFWDISAPLRHVN